MNRLFSAIMLITLLGFLAPAQAEIGQSTQKAQFNEQMAIQQVLGVIGGANVRQADRTSTQVMKEFTAWRDKMEALGPQQPANEGRKLPPVRDRRAF